AIAAYLLGTYIYSPQLNIVLIPLLAIMDFRHPALYPWDGFNVLIILTWFLSPSFVLGGVCSGGATTCPTLAGTWAQLFALLRAGSLAWISIAIAAREGHSLTGWVRSLVRRPSAPITASATVPSSP
ncbi:MAG TPA: hypothetical protein VKF39_01590, partial [Nitrososphaerales archaeon]|nr:hypothetical protein [Nitrososphaerales archaeon]